MVRQSTSSNRERSTQGRQAVHLDCLLLKSGTRACRDRYCGEGHQSVGKFDSLNDRDALASNTIFQDSKADSLPAEVMG